MRQEGKWHVFARQLTVPMIASTVLTVLCFMSCGTSRTLDRTSRSTRSVQNADSQRNASAGLLMAGIPESVMKLKIPVVDLLSLPPNASFHGKEGRAGAGVALRGDTLVVTATCDSLQRLVLWYESELTRIRSETKSEISNDVQTEEKRPPNPVRVFILGMVAGLLVGMLLTMKLKKR